jgi:demethylmenaquinone methyltransferase/2-methoxy-6-polyprenyl-1,4-benzoquinol methylase
MTDIGKTKLPNLTFKIASATKLPFENESVDILSISYGIRNVMQRKEALAEFYRVLKPNGIVVILEFTKNESTGYLAKITDFYLSNILPKLGGFISKNKEAYTYLPDSIEDFTTTKKLTNELLESGFNIKEIKAFSFDISTMFIAQK